MNILLIYGDEQGTFGRYWKNALAKKHTAITCGPQLKGGTSQDIETNKEIVDITEIIEKLKPSQKPDLILQIEAPCHLYLKNLDKVDAKTAFFWTDVTIKLPILRHYASCFNYLFTACESFVPILGKTGLHSFYLPFAVDPEVHRDSNLKREIDVGFVGHLSDFYNPKRTFYLRYLLSHIPLTIKTKIYEKNMAKFYSQCKIVFNLSVTPGINMRTFEALACGCLLVQNASCTDIAKYFTNGQDFVAYKSAKDATALIKYYLAHPKERQRIAANGQKKVLKYHTYQKRADKLIDIIKNKPPQRKSKEKIEAALGKSVFMSNLNLPKDLNGPLIPKIVPRPWHRSFVFIIKQLETLGFKWTIPFWYMALLLLPLTLKFQKDEHS